jgi:hypothetical protein
VAKLHFGPPQELVCDLEHRLAGGNENTGVGDAALTFSNTGNNNTAVGSGALEASS